MIQYADLPLATTRQFRDAVRTIVKDYRGYGSYTDKFTGKEKESDKRYVKILTGRSPTQKDIDTIEFILWTQKVTANTRIGNYGVRGTCLLKEKK